VEWLDRFGIPYWDLCFMRDKDAVGADLYIEDSPENVCALREKNCEVIVFANSTNRCCAAPRAQSWEEVYELVMERYQNTRKEHAE
jgi:5'(3')-deoxyribonucleotidase